MVTAVILIIGLAIAAFIFRDKIALFLGASIGEPIIKGAEALATTITSGAEEVGKSVDATFIDPVRAAGEAAGRAEAERKTKEAIARAEKDLELAAKEQGFETIEAFNKATDSGAVVIGGAKTVVDFGLIGDVLPTDPSPEFLASPEKFLTDVQLAEFKAIFNKTATTRGTKRFGGQR